MKKIALGIDIGGTNTAIGTVAQDGTVINKTSIPTPTDGDVDSYITSIKTAVKELINSLKSLDSDTEVLGIGIGAPNANYHKGTIEHAPNLAFKGVVPLVAKLKEAMPEMKYISLTNDANAAALGELIYGGGRGMKDFIMYTLGTGVGSGIIVNGDLVYGHDGFAGECGHTMLVPGGRVCGCGVNGHLESYCSAGGIKRTAFELMAYYNANDSLLADKSFRDLEAKDVSIAAAKGDKIALETFRVTGDYLARGIADSIHHTAPEAVFLFGGPTAAGDLLMNPLKEALSKYLLPTFKNSNGEPKAKILISQLKAGDAAIVGASALVWKEEEKN
ncbi:MAG: ROK family protein [Marinilabiliaceae bacterium]|nr:ROK family protein [Marinilabiliaceae bacterium]